MFDEMIEEAFAWECSIVFRAWPRDEINLPLFQRSAFHGSRTCRKACRANRGERGLFLGQHARKPGQRRKGRMAVQARVPLFASRVRRVEKTHHLSILIHGEMLLHALQLVIIAKHLLI